MIIEASGGKSKIRQETPGGDRAFIWLRINAVACDLDFVVLALAIHLRVDAKASSATFTFGQRYPVGAGGTPFTVAIFGRLGTQ